MDAPGWHYVAGKEPAQAARLVAGLLAVDFQAKRWIWIRREATGRDTRARADDVVSYNCRSL
ncbi:hypothetical protein [Massilia sp. DD77]|uniref:hypothetical protein n=1 Tax=Massilia sp. DD77 TaxID=3109349 RepID=UPI002FFDB389